MTILRILSLLLGTLMVLGILGSALKTVVLPQEGFPRLAQAVFALVHRLLIHPRRRGAHQANLRSLYAPVALVSLPLVWMLLMVVAFSFVFWGTGGLTWQGAFEVSGSSLTTLGFSKPGGTGRIWLSFIEATIGLGLVAMLISYLPTIYSSYNAREKGVITLRPLAGTPPTAPEFLESLYRLGSLDTPAYWQGQANWILDIEQTHTAFPILSYFPENHADHSWVASVGTLLDAAALVLSATGGGGPGGLARSGAVFADMEKGPLATVVYGVPAVGRIARAAGVPLSPPAQISELAAHFTEPAPDVSVTRAEYLAALSGVAPILGVEPGDEEAKWRQFAHIRSGYDRPLRALAGLTLAPPAPWTTDRPAEVGRPRFIRRRPLHVDWSGGFESKAVTSPA
jgi:hypothetical protein